LIIKIFLFNYDLIMLIRNYQNVKYFVHEEIVKIVGFFIVNLILKNQG